MHLCIVERGVLLPTCGVPFQSAAFIRSRVAVISKNCTVGMTFLRGGRRQPPCPRFLALLRSKYQDKIVVHFDR